MQHMVDALVAPLGTSRPFDGGDVRRFLDDADLAMVARGAGAIDAWIDIGDAVADGAQAQADLQAAHRLGQSRCILVAGAQDMEGKPLGALRAHSRQLLQLFNQPRHWLGITAHMRPLQTSIDNAGEGIAVHKALGPGGV
jgi:hypothetical protein